jgi:hypothetical protein
MRARRKHYELKDKRSQMAREEEMLTYLAGNEKFTKSVLERIKEMLNDEANPVSDALKTKAQAKLKRIEQLLATLSRLVPSSGKLVEYDEMKTVVEKCCGKELLQKKTDETLARAIELQSEAGTAYAKIKRRLDAFLDGGSEWWVRCDNSMVMAEIDAVMNGDGASWSCAICFQQISNSCIRTPSG